MARPIKEGLQYFPLDVDIDQDDKILVIEAVHGIEGFAVLIKLLMKVYKEGYFYKWSKREQLIFSKRVNVDINAVDNIVSDSLEEGFFDKTVFNKHGVLTSKGIQVRYLEAITRRKVVYFDKRYLLIDPQNHIPPNAKIEIVLLDHKLTETEVTEVNVYNNPKSVAVNDNISTQSKEEYIKEEDIKEYHHDNREKSEPKKEPQKNPMVDDDLKVVVKFYESNFGMMPAMLYQVLPDDFDRFGKDLMIEAMQRAVLANAKNYAYVLKILNNWESKNVRTMQDVAGLDTEFTNQKQKNGPSYGRKQKEEKVPEWFEKHKSTRGKGEIVEVDEVGEDYLEAKRELLKKLGVKEEADQ